MGKSTSSDHDVWHGVHREQRRGSLPRGNLENQQSGKIHILYSFTEWLADVIFQPWGPGGRSQNYCESLNLFWKSNING